MPIFFEPSFTVEFCTYGPDETLSDIGSVHGFVHGSILTLSLFVQRSVSTFSVKTVVATERVSSTGTVVGVKSKVSKHGPTRAYLCKLKRRRATTFDIS